MKKNLLPGNLKFILLIISICTLATSSYSQSGTWIWMKGDSTAYGVPVYGTKGISDPANVPGAMRDAAAWTDLDGNLWLFGGWRDLLSEYNTLWKYDIAINEWTWIRGDTNCCSSGIYGIEGVPAASNTPGARYGSGTWIDLDGNLWLYGGFGYDKNGLPVVSNDLWKYDIATNEWTWMNGDKTQTHDPVYGTLGVPDAANNPGSRAEYNSSWTDAAGNLWMFGGTLYTACGSGCYIITGVGNDVWKYDLTTDEWTWVKGSNLVNQPGTYGIQGVPDDQNMPGGRSTYARWINGHSNFWLFGGSDVFGNSYWNDVWMYDLINNTWTWMAGADTANGVGTYGTKCIAAENKGPSARTKYASWSGNAGNLYVWGGLDFNVAARNDLWYFSANSGQWKWMNGDTTVEQKGSYGIQGVPSLTNLPPSKFATSSWIDLEGNLWLFGGHSMDFDVKNDLWKYVPDPDCINAFATLAENSSLSFSGFSVYPNPASGKVVIELPATGNGLLTIRITNSFGQQVFSFEEKYAPLQTMKKEIDLSKADEGLYIIELKTSELTLQKKVMIIH